MVKVDLSNRKGQKIYSFCSGDLYPLYPFIMESFFFPFLSLCKVDNPIEHALWLLEYNSSPGSRWHIWPVCVETKTIEVK